MKKTIKHLASAMAVAFFLFIAFGSTKNLLIVVAMVTGLLKTVKLFLVLMIVIVNPRELRKVLMKKANSSKVFSK